MRAPMGRDPPLSLKSRFSSVFEPFSKQTKAFQETCVSKIDKRLTSPQFNVDKTNLGALWAVHQSD